MSKIFSISLILVTFAINGCYQTANSVIPKFKYQNFVSVKPDMKLSGTYCAYRGSVMQETGSLEINSGPALPKCTSMATFNLPQRTNRARATLAIHANFSDIPDWWWKDRGKITLRVQAASFNKFGKFRGKVARLKEFKLVEVGKGQRVVIADVSHMIPRGATRLQVGIEYEVGISKTIIKEMSLRFHN